MWTGDVAQWQSACLVCTRPWVHPQYRERERERESRQIANNIMTYTFCEKEVLGLPELRFHSCCGVFVH